MHIELEVLCECGQISGVSERKEKQNLGNITVLLFNDVQPHFQLSQDHSDISCNEIIKRPIFTPSSHA